MFGYRLRTGITYSLLIIGNSVFAQNVGISQAAFNSHYPIQQTPTWCWASSAEMVLSYEGINIPQDTIVTKVKGAPISGGGNPYEIVKATNGVFTDRYHM